jgi:DNA polymerase (family 10)
VPTTTSRRAGYPSVRYSIEETATHRAIACRTEKEVYATLGLPWIPPELRENRGELEAAREDRLPRLVTLADLRGDLHVHSDWSDGRATIEEMARAAQAAGLEYICFCDHSQSLGMGKGLTPTRVLAQIAEIRAAGADVARISLLAGSEVDILADGRIDLPDEVLAQLDFVTASIHSGFQEPMDRIMKRLTAACENPHIDAIGHPTGRLLGRRDPYPVDIDRLVTLAAETNTILEVNASYHRLDLSAPHARLARDRGALLMICSDAHSPSGYDALRFGVGEARRGWVEADDVVNTWSLDRLRVSRAGLSRRSRGGG